MHDTISYDHDDRSIYCITPVFIDRSVHECANLTQVCTIVDCQLSNCRIREFANACTARVIINCREDIYTHACVTIVC